MKISDLKNSIKKVPTHIWILLLITVVGTFLRTYHFRDWLIFNSDQARDATVIENILNGKKTWLMLGPEAGSTLFDLGPWFYYLEAVSAKIFGNAPDKLAYPDLLFSILAIPLFYIFAKKYFKRNLSLLLTFFLSTSSFMIFYSRFASNPNSIPFFSLLFFLGMLILLNSEEKRFFWGAAMVGIGIGVGLQLHILLFFVMPVVVSLFF
jgi:4-amino-4-deoxy-L-arabinose transferase-like glycosyltransferase